MQDFSITTHLKYPEYFRMQFNLRYSKPWIQIITILGMLFLIAYLFALKVYHYDFWSSDFSAVGFFFLYFAVIFPLISFYMIRKSFKGNLRLQEPIIYQFSEQGITCSGESFSSTYSWDKLYKVQTFQGWLLIYHSSMGYSLIKLQPDDDSHMQSLKQFLQTQSYKLKINM